ncbi:hypothetical protein FQN49_004022 [Arthroderma sp. PD_2]|nr:hypothetical protein FQN49_004022 [Arthroderma sp. PD_2]
MARLNDLPTTLDSIESLKRRFIRQNREIARANSVQSIRIRTLEAEVSHLLAENVTLREGIISVNHELDRYRTGTHFENRINTLRERFESGLGELSALVKDLNKLPSQYRDNGVRAVKENRAGQEEETKRISPRSLLRLSEDETMLEDGGCLPAIPEDRVYAPDVGEQAEEEILQDDDIIEPVQVMNDVESTEKRSEPEPLAKGRDVLTSTNVSSDESHLTWATKKSTVADVLEKVRPINTRPKRRDSSLVQSLVSKKDIEIDRDVAPPATIAGAKRKFDAQECEALPQDTQEHDEFQYTLSKKPQNQLPNDIGVGAENQADPISVGKENLKSRVDPVKSRRALGPKNVNFNPRSTTKKAAHDSVAVEKRKAPGRKRTETRNTRHKTLDQLTDPKAEVLIRDEVPLLNNPVEISLDDQSHDLLPKETISESVNSLDKPSYSEHQPITHSERQAQRPRPSRRSRGSVNYAEPSLRGKMRRPTEDLVDAVAERTTKRLSRSQNDPIDDLQSEQQSIGIDINPSSSASSQSYPNNIFDLSASNLEGKQSLHDSNYTSDTDTDTERQWSNNEQRARSMRAPTPDPSIRPVRQSRRNSLNPNHRGDMNSVAHISA